MHQQPTYRVFIEGKSRREVTEFVEKIDFEDCSEEDSFATISVYPNKAISAIDDDDFIVGKLLSFSFGYLGGEMSEYHILRIVDAPILYTGTKAYFTLKCLDKGHLMRKTNVNNRKLWSGSISQIAKDIAETYGLTIEVDPKLSTIYERVYTHIPQGNRHDMAFLRYLVKREAGGNYIAYIRGGVLYIVNRATDKEALRTYTYGDGNGTVVSISIENKDAIKEASANSVTATAVETKAPLLDFAKVLPGGAVWNQFGGNTPQKVLIKAVQDNSSQNTGTLGEKHQLSFDENLEFKQVSAGTTSKLDGSKVSSPRISDTEVDQLRRIKDKLGSVDSALLGIDPTISKHLTDPTGDKAELDNLANAHKKQHHGIEATITVVGAPTLVPNTVIALAGVARRHVGNWLIFKAVHSFGTGGYTTKLYCRKNGSKKGINKASDANTKQSASTEQERGGNGKKITIKKNMNLE